jgi:hypothetical protein
MNMEPFDVDEVGRFEQPLFSSLTSGKKILKKWLVSSTSTGCAQLDIR